MKPFTYAVISKTSNNTFDYDQISNIEQLLEKDKKKYVHQILIDSLMNSNQQFIHFIVSNPLIHPNDINWFNMPLIHTYAEHNDIFIKENLESQEPFNLDETLIYFFIESDNDAEIILNELSLLLQLNSKRKITLNSTIRSLPEWVIQFWPSIKIEQFLKRIVFPDGMEFDFKYLNSLTNEEKRYSEQVFNLIQNPFKFINDDRKLIITYHHNSISAKNSYMFIMTNDFPTQLTTLFNYAFTQTHN